MDMEKKSPLRDVMNSTMEKVREMVDANNIVGAPITTPDGVTLIPISRVSFGFGSGGGDYGKPGQNNFGGGGGAGVKIDPVAFLVIKDGTTRVSSPAFLNCWTSSLSGLKGGPMEKQYKAVFFDLGGTLRIAFLEEAYMRHARRKMAEIAGTDMPYEEFYQMIEERYEPYRKWALGEFKESGDEELWCKWLLPDYDPARIRQVCHELSFQYRQCKGRREVTSCDKLR